MSDITLNDLNNFIFSFGNIKDDVQAELNKRKLSDYNLSNRVPWTCVTSGRRKDNSPLTRLKFGDVYKSMQTLYDASNRPMPVLKELAVKYVDELGALKLITLTMTIHSKQQLEDYLEYFFSLGAPILVEYGILNENHVYEFSEEELNSAFSSTMEFGNVTRKRIKKANYKYNNFAGIISNFNISYNQNGTYECSIEAKSVGILAYSFNIKNQFGYDITKTVTEEDDTVKNKETIEYFVDNLLPSLIDDILNDKINSSASPLELIEDLKHINKINVYKANGKDKRWISFAFIEAIMNHICGIISKNNKDQILYKISSYLPVKLSNTGIFADEQQIIIKNHPSLNSIDIERCFIRNVDNSLDSKALKFKYKDGKTNYGYLRHIYVELEIVQNLIKSATTISDFFTSLYSEINSNFAQFWQFRLVFNDELKQIFTVDINTVEEFDTNTPGLFMFNTLANEYSLVRDISFSTQASDAQNLQVLNSSDDGSVINDKSNESTAFWSVSKAKYQDVFFKSNSTTTGSGETDKPKSSGTSTTSSTSSLPPTDKQLETTYPQYKTATPEEKTKLKSDYIANQNKQDKTVNNKNEISKSDLDKAKEYQKEKINELSNNYKSYGLLYTHCQMKYDVSAPMLNLNEVLINKVFGPKRNKYYTPLNAITLDLKIDGISGILIGNSFGTDILPQIYLQSGVMQITEISETINSSGWILDIKAMFRLSFESMSSATQPQTGGNKVTSSTSSTPINASSKDVLKWIKIWFGPIIEKEVQRQASKGWIIDPNYIAGLIYTETGGVIAKLYDGGKKSPDEFADQIYNKDASSYSYSFFQFYYPYWKDFVDSGKWKNVSLATSAAIQHLVDKRKYLNNKSPENSVNAIDDYALMAYNAGEGNAIKKLVNNDLEGARANNSGYVNKVLKYAEDYKNIVV